MEGHYDSNNTDPQWKLGLVRKWEDRDAGDTLRSSLTVQMGRESEYTPQGPWTSSLKHKLFFTCFICHINYNFTLYFIIYFSIKQEFLLNLWSKMNDPKLV